MTADGRGVVSHAGSRLLADMAGVTGLDAGFGEVDLSEDRQWQDYLATLARVADERRRDLGRRAAAEAPIWAVEALRGVFTRAR